MAVTDDILKATIKRLFSEDVSTEDSGASLLEISDDPIQLDGVIDKVLPDAVAQCSVASPRGGVNPSKNTIYAVYVPPTPVEEETNGGGSVSPLLAAPPPVATGSVTIDVNGLVAIKNGTTVPEYIRMNWMKLSDPAWRKPVYTVTDPTSALAEAQYNVYTASKEDNPVVVWTMTDSGKGLLAFPHKTAPTHVSDAAMGEICYDMKYDSNAGLATDNPDYVMAVCHMAVSLLYEVFERGDAAERHKALAMALING